MSKRYRIMSTSRGMWWKPNRMGYTTDRREAGVYSQEEAEEIHTEAKFEGKLQGCEPDDVPEEIKDESAAEAA